MSSQIDQIKEMMKETSERVDFWLNKIFFFLVVSLLSGTVFLLTGTLNVAYVFLGVPAALILFAFTGFVIVHPEERIMVEFLGKPYCIKKPGLKWTLPILMYRRLWIDTWEQRVDLFPERKYPNGIHIDLKNGGKTELVEPVLWVQLIGVGTEQEEENILRTVYAIDDWKDATEENGENALRTCLNNLTVDQVMTAIKSKKKHSWWEEVSKSFPDLGNTIKEYGIEPKRLTISDFNWDEKVVAKRQEIFEEERSIELAKLSLKAAQNEVAQKALEAGGLYGSIVTLLKKEEYGGFNRQEAEKVAEQLVLYFKAAETNSLVDVRGSAELSTVISTIFGAMRAFKKGGGKSLTSSSLTQ